MRHWVECELELRVGIGHDILGQLRHAIGLHHYLMRKGKKSRGLKQSIGISKQQSNAAINKGKLISKYIKNWNRLNGLITSGVIPQRGAKQKLKGLQELNRQQDIRFFQEWGEQSTNFMDHQKLNVTWIWRIAMNNRSPGKYRGSVKKMTDEWESEGLLASL